MNYELLPLFSYPVMTTKLDLGDTDILLKVLSDEDKEQMTYTPFDYKRSVRKDILLFPEFEEIAKQIKSFLNIYLRDILKYKSHFQITNSWGMWADGVHSGQARIHWHEKSICSGVLTLYNDDIEKSVLKFTNGLKTTPWKEIPVEEHNVYNSLDWWVPQIPGHLHLFPSNLLHSVSPLTKDGKRVNIAFDVDEIA